MEWAQILVIILSVILALFLLAGIALVVTFIRLTHQIKTVTNTAERTMHDIEDAVRGISKASYPLLIAKMIAKRLKKTKKKEEDV